MKDPIFIASKQNFEGYLLLVSALILLLNDEQPDIRYYLCHSGLTEMLELEDEWTL